MQLSALTGPVVSHFCCHKFTSTAVMMEMENLFWLRQISVVLSFFYKGAAGRFSVGALGEEK